MKLWMRIGQPVDGILGNHQRTFDAWADGGVRGLVIGRMVFMADVQSGLAADAIPAFSPNQSIYHTLGVEPPPSPPQFPEKRKQLNQLLDDAKARGWMVLIFEPAAFRGPGGSGNPMLDAEAQRAYFARAQDTLEAFPQVDGAIIDGPEWPYEIAPSKASETLYGIANSQRHSLFADFPSSTESCASALGYEFPALVQAQRRLFDRLHSLDESRVAELATGGFVGALALLGYDAGLADWLRFRMDTLTAFVRALREHLDQLSRPISLGMGPRTASFAPLAGYDFGRLAAILDYLLPKHYFWHRGYDGMYGTLARYVQTLVEWNPGLSERSAFAVVRALIGVQVDGVDTLSALDDGFPPPFFTDYVTDQTRRALAAVGDPDRVVPWVDVGRRPHEGDPIAAGDFRRILNAAASVGLRRFLFHNHTHLNQAEWSVIAEMCGEKWRGPDVNGFRPPDGLHLSPVQR